MEAYSASHTETYSFNCPGDVVHGICTSCDSRMFRRHDDRCPLCRADRHDASVAAHNSRHPRPVGRPTSMAVLSDSRGRSIFFPIDESTDTVGAPVFELRPPRPVDDGDSSSLMQRLVEDDALAEAIHSLRNAHRIPLSQFIVRVARARSVRDARVAMVARAARDAQDASAGIIEQRV